MFVVGGREMEQGQVSVRDRIEGDLGGMSVAAAIEKLRAEVADRTVRQTFAGDAGLGDPGAGNEY
jgi:threonyl-tRNA synthetase